MSDAATRGQPEASESESLAFFWPVGRVTEQGAHLAALPLEDGRLEGLLALEKQLRELPGGRELVRGRELTVGLRGVHYYATWSRSPEEEGVGEDVRRQKHRDWCERVLRQEAPPYGLCMTDFLTAFDADKFDTYSAPTPPNHSSGKLQVQRGAFIFHASDDFPIAPDDRFKIRVHLGELAAYRALMAEPEEQTAILEALIEDKPTLALDLIEGIEVLGSNEDADRYQVTPTAKQARRLLASDDRHIRQRALLALKQLDQTDRNVAAESIETAGRSR